MKKTLFCLSCLTYLIFLSVVSAVSAQTIVTAPGSLTGVLEVGSTDYAYNPETGLLTKTYMLTNISGETLQNPKMVNLFLWSNDISSPDWAVMPFDAFSTYANTDQSATIANNNGFIGWSAEVTPNTISSAALFSDLPVQTVQPGVSYPYWNVPGFSKQWPNGHLASLEVQFSEVPNCNWVQNMLWVVYGDEKNPGEKNPIQIDKCKVKAGKNGKGDRIKFKGLLYATEAVFNAAIGGNVIVTIAADAIPDLNVTTYTFPIEEDNLKKGKYKSTKIKPLDKSDPKTSFKINTSNGKMKFSAKNVDLTGLSCPITVTIQIGDYVAEIVLDEEIVNGPKKPCPPELMTGV